FLDIWMERMDGLETLAEIKRTRPDAIVVMISGHGTIETAVKATKLGAYDFIEKPLSLEKTLLIVTRALEHARLARENAALRESLAGRAEIIGESEPVRRRHALPGRNRRHEPEDAGEGAPGARGAGIRARRRQGHGADRRARDRGVQPRSRDADPRRALPGGPLLPSQRHPDRGARPARAQGRHPVTRGSLHRALLRGERQAAQDRLGRGARLLRRLRLARERARAPQHGGTPRDHDPRRRDRG